MILIRQQFSSFATQNTTSEQENQCKKMHYEFRFLETHHSTIPLFHHSNWGETPKFSTEETIMEPYSLFFSISLDTKNNIF